MFLSYLISIFFTNFAQADICETKYTLMHYAQSECVEVARPLKPNSTETFNLRTVIIAKDLSLKKERPTVVIVPGGPGQSADDLKIAFQEREVINSMWGSMLVNVVMYDPRGTGLSNLPRPTTSYDPTVLSLDLFVEDLKAVIENTSNNKPVILLAHSAGGHITTRFAEKYPQLVAKLVYISSSISPRQMGELNMAQQAWDSYHWRRFLKTIKDDKQNQLWNKKYQRVEDILKQQQKARILKKHVHPQWPRMSVMAFREKLISSVELDPTGQTFMAFVAELLTTAEFAEINGTALVPDDLRKLKLKESDFGEYTFDDKAWIQRAFVCGEGLSLEEIKAPLYLDGINLDDHFCRGLYNTTGFAEPVLENISIPVLFFSGQQDTQVPTYIAREITSRFPNAKLVTAPDAGHLFVNVHPHIFYKEMEAFIAK